MHKKVRLHQATEYIIPLVLNISLHFVTGNDDHIRTCNALIIHNEIVFGRRSLCVACIHDRHPKRLRGRYHPTAVSSNGAISAAESLRVRPVTVPR